MSTKDIGRFAILFIGAMVIAFGLLPARLSAQELTLTSGTTTLVAAGDAACVTQVTVRNNNNQGVVGRQGCPGNRAITFLSTGTLVPNTVDLTASTRFVKQFHVAAVQGAPKSSFLPVLIAVPVSWQGVLNNDSVIPPVGPLQSVGANVDVNMFLRLTQGTPTDPARATVTENRFNAASNAGISGCLSIPTDGPAAVALAATCVGALLVAQTSQGTATVYLSTIVETGKTYNIELELLTDLFSFNTSTILHPSGHPEANFEQNQVTSAPFGLTWTDPMSITVGTDFQSTIQALQDEITQLRADLNMLRQEFKTHTHVYLTGKGVGQNNTRASTSPPLFP